MRYVGNRAEDVKIAYIGGGSRGWAWGLMSDLAAVEDMSGKVLLLEALGGDVPKMATYLSQLNQLHVFDQISGVLLGTFTEMEKNGYSPSVEELIKQYVNEKTPVAKTQEIGHGKDAKAVRIGAEIVLDSRQVDKNGKQCG